MSIADRTDKNAKALAQQEAILSSDEITYKAGRFSQPYVDAVFTLWYSSGKVKPAKLSQMIPNPSEFGLDIGYPSQSTLQSWIESSFLDRAKTLDDEVFRQISDRLVAEKVQMLESHATIASSMQSMALDYLEANRDKLSANSAIRLLVEGVRIERESRGIPRTLERMMEKSDEDLLSEITDMLSRAPVQYESIDDSEEE